MFALCTHFRLLGQLSAATLRAIRYDIANNKVKDKFTSHIGIYPLCSIDNVLDGHKLATAFYGLDLPTYFAFCGKSCFDIEARRPEATCGGNDSKPLFLVR